MTTPPQDRAALVALVAHWRKLAGVRAQLKVDARRAFTICADALDAALAAPAGEPACICGDCAEGCVKGCPVCRVVPAGEPVGEPEPSEARTCPVCGMQLLGTVGRVCPRHGDLAQPFEASNAMNAQPTPQPSAPVARCLLCHQPKDRPDSGICSICAVEHNTATAPSAPAAVLHCPTCGAANDGSENGWVHRAQAAEARLEDLKAVLPEPSPGVKPTTFRWHDNEPHRWVNYSRETPPFRMCSICGGTEEMEPMPEPVDVEQLARQTAARVRVLVTQAKWAGIDDAILAALRRVQPPQEPKTCATCRHCVPYPANKMYLACYAPAPVQIFTPKKAATWGCTLHEPAPTDPQEGGEK
jgi:hypothetical protein